MLASSFEHQMSEHEMSASSSEHQMSEHQILASSSEHQMSEHQMSEHEMSVCSLKHQMCSLNYSAERHARCRHRRPSGWHKRCSSTPHSRIHDSVTTWRQSDHGKNTGILLCVGQLLRLYAHGCTQPSCDIYIQFTCLLPRHIGSARTPICLLLSQGVAPK